MTAPYTKSIFSWGMDEADFLAFARAHDLSLVHTEPEDEERQVMRRLEFSHATIPGAVHFLYNYKADVYTARCYGEGQQRLAAVITSIYNLVDADAVRSEFRSADPDTRAAAMSYLSELAPATCDDALLPLFALGARDPEPVVREATFLAMGFVMWPEFLPLVEAALAIETDEYLLGQLERRRSGLVAAT